jgi:hypothetical protein
MERERWGSYRRGRGVVSAADYRGRAERDRRRRLPVRRNSSREEEPDSGSRSSAKKKEEVLRTAGPGWLTGWAARSGWCLVWAPGAAQLGCALLLSLFF